MEENFNTTEGKLKCEMDVISLFTAYDQTKGKISYYIKDVICPDREVFSYPKSPNGEVDRCVIGREIVTKVPTNAEFEQLYQAKLTAHRGTKDDFINSEIDQIDNKMIFPDFVIKEYKIINQWKKFLVEKKDTQQSAQETDNISIPILWKMEHHKEYITKCYNNSFTKRGKKKPLFYMHPIKDVFVFDRIYRTYDIAQKKGLFDVDINFEAATNEYCNGFRNGYREFESKVSNDLRYNESTIFKTATQFYSPVSWYPHTYKNGKIIPQNWDILGDKIGRFYAAWCIVLEHQNNFEPLFLELTKQNEPNPEPKPPHFTIKLNELQLQQLYTGLTKGGFLSTDTDQKAFDYVFGACDKPTDFKGLIWLKGKQYLRELLTPIKHPDIRLAELEKLVPLYFIDQKGKEINLAKNKEHLERPDSKAIIRILKEATV